MLKLFFRFVMARFKRASHVIPAIGREFLDVSEWFNAMGGPLEAGQDGIWGSDICLTPNRTKRSCQWHCIAEFAYSLDNDQRVEQGK